MKAELSRTTRTPRVLADVDRSFFYKRAWALALPLLFAWLWCASDLFAAVYEVGPGKPYARIIDCPTHNLMAGDSILVYYNPEPYKEKFLLHGVGTAEQPITLRGVPDASGNKPVIDGADAASSRVVDYRNEERQIIKIGQYASHLSDHIIVDGFVFKNANSNHSFIDDQGVSSAYLNNACAVRPEYANHVVIRNCEITNNGIGLQNGVGNPSQRLLVEKCHIYDNGAGADVFQDSITGDDPGFLDFQAGDYHLSDLSNCRDMAAAYDFPEGHDLTHQYIEDASLAVRSVENGAMDIGATEAPPLRETEFMMAAGVSHDASREDNDAAPPSGEIHRRVAALMETGLLFDHASSDFPGEGYDGNFFSRLASSILDGDMTLMDEVATINSFTIRGKLMLEGSTISLNFTMK